jgi:predicted dehydrogenase
MIKLGIIGFGYWGPFIARNVNNIEDLELQAIRDKREQACRKAASFYPGARITTEAVEVIKDPGNDAVAIVTPVSSHYELAKMALEAGKHIFVKSLSLSLPRKVKS